MPGFSFLTKSIVNIVAAEFSVELSAAVKAARNPATTRPINPGGRISNTSFG